MCLILLIIAHSGSTNFHICICLRENTHNPEGWKIKVIPMTETAGKLLLVKFLLYENLIVFSTSISTDMTAKNRSTTNYRISIAIKAAN